MDNVDEIQKSYIRAQFEKLTLSTNYPAAMLQIKGSKGGSTNWLNISGEKLLAIRNILEND